TRSKRDWSSDVCSSDLEMEFNEIAGQEIVYSFVKNNTYIYRKNEICEKLSCHFINMDIYKHFDELVNLDLISIDELEKVYSKKRSILSYVAENYNENTLEMM